MTLEEMVERFPLKSEVVYAAPVPEKQPRMTVTRHGTNRASGSDAEPEKAIFWLRVEHEGWDAYELWCYPDRFEPAPSLVA